MKIADLPPNVREIIHRGCAIPACPLALDAQRRFDARHQRALVRYYVDSGAGGLAVGVHSTQFEIREPEHALYEPVLRFVSDAIEEWHGRDSGRPFARIAGICGRTQQARREAQFAVDAGYHAGLLSLAAYADDDLDTILDHCAEVARDIPLFGFYLQPAVGGRLLPFDFWRRFFEIDNVIAAKVAPFNRYHTLDVMRGLAAADRVDEITLYTGNDDHIVKDLLTAYEVMGPKGPAIVRFKGGLLGHWAVWTSRAVRLLNECRAVADRGAAIPATMLTMAEQVTDANGAVFDVANQFAGCLAGIHEVLRRQGLLAGTWCLNPDETLSPGQAEELDRIYHEYPEQTDDAFVAQNLHRWLEN